MNRLNLILLLALLLVCGLWAESCESHKETKALLYFVQDTLTRVKDKHGVQTASIAVLQADYNQLVKDVHSKDSTIIRLQGTAKKYKKDLDAATSIDLETKERVTQKDTIIKSDTVFKSGKEYVYPVYQAMIRRRYSSYFVTASKDSVEVVANIKNKLDVNWVYKRDTTGNIFHRKLGPKRLIADIKTYNQNTETVDVHSFKPLPKKGAKTWRTAERILCFASGFFLNQYIHKP